MSAFLEALPVIVSLVVIEGLLSVDNALAIAAMAAHLPAHKQRVALRYGIVGAYVFRGVALSLTSWIIANPWIKVLGALYLIYLMCSHLTRPEEENGSSGGARQMPGLFQTILQIEIMDLSLSIDNVVAAVILSPKLWVVCTGVFIGILALRFVAGYCIRLLQRYPVLAQTAFLLVGFVGFLLFFELGTGKHVSSFEKFVGICGVVLVSLLYARFGGLRAVLFPVLRVAVVLMRLFTLVCESLFWPLRMLHQRIRRVFSRRPPRSGPQSVG